MSEIIYFNGKRYNSVSEMPSSVRQNYEKFSRLFLDADRDGIPDIMQSGGISSLKETLSAIKDIAQLSGTEGISQEQFSIVQVTDSDIYVNGKRFDSVEEMPSHVRYEYERIVNSAQDGRVDIYDEPWREVEREEYFTPHDDEILNRPNQSRRSIYNTPIETVDSTSRFLIIAVIAILLFGCIAAAWFLFYNLSL